MKNDSSIKFTPLKITIAVVISLILHLVFFTNFNFNQLFISKNTDQSDELEKTPTKKGPADAGPFLVEKKSLNYMFSLLTTAEKYSRFMRAMLVMEMPFGHSASHAPVLVQAPKPSESI